MAAPIAPGAPVAPAPAPVIWQEDPDTDNINPGTRTGLTAFNDRAKGHPEGKLFSDSFEDSKEFQIFVRSRSKALGTAVT